MKKFAIFGGIGVGVIIIIVLVVLFTTTTSGSNSSRIRKNTIIQIKRYYTNEEYDRALDLIDNLLTQNANDTEAVDLQNEILSAKKKDKNLKEEQQKEDLQKLLDAKNNFVEQQNETPYIVTRKKHQGNDNGLSQKEQEKRDKIDNYIDDGINNLSNKEYARAKKSFENALSLDGNNGEAHAYLGATIYEENPEDDGAISDAIKHCKKAIKQDSTLEGAHYTLAKIYDNQNLKDEALNEYKKTLSLNPQNYEAAYAMGKIYYKKKEYNKAEMYFNKSITINKEFVNGYFYIALTEYRLNKKDKSKYYYERATQIDPTFYVAFANLAQVYKSEKNYNEAIKNYTKALKLNNNYKYHYKIAECYESLQKFDDAIDSYITSITLNPKNDSTSQKYVINSYIGIGVIENNRGRYSETIKYINQGLELDNTNVNLYAISAYANMKLNNYSDAIEQYNFVIKNNPSFIEAYLNLSDIYSSQGEYEKAISIAKQGLQIKTNYYKLYNNMGDAYQKLGDFNKAVDSYNKSISYNSKDLAVYKNLGTCYKELQDYEKVVSTYKVIINLDSTDYDAYFELGSAYLQLGKNDEAKMVLQMLKDQKPDYSKIDKVDEMLATLNM